MERTDYQKSLIEKTDKELFGKYEAFLNNMSKDKLKSFRNELKWMLNKVQTERASTTPELLKSWGFDMNKMVWLQYFGFVAHYHEDKPYIWNYDSSNYKTSVGKSYFTFENLFSDLDLLTRD